MLLFDVTWNLSVWLQDWRKGSRITSSGCRSSASSWTSWRKTPLWCGTRSGNKCRSTATVCEDDTVPRLLFAAVVQRFRLWLGQKNNTTQENKTLLWSLHSLTAVVSSFTQYLSSVISQNAFLCPCTVQLYDSLISTPSWMVFMLLSY